MKEIGAALDRVLAASRVLAPYIGDRLKKKDPSAKIAGHLHIDTPRAFGELYTRETGKEVGDTLGYTDVKSLEIYLAERNSRMGDALHEAIHRISGGAQALHNSLGLDFMEGTTELITNGVLTELKLEPGTAYPKEVAAASAVESVVGFDMLARAYFGKTEDVLTLLKELKARRPKGFATWRAKLADGDMLGSAKALSTEGAAK